MPCRARAENIENMPELQPLCVQSTKKTRNIYKVSLLLSALYAKCPYYLVLYMQSVEQTEGGYMHLRVPCHARAAPPRGAPALHPLPAPAGGEQKRGQRRTQFRTIKHGEGYLFIQNK